MSGPSILGPQLAFFHADPARAKSLDAYMRRRLASSLAHIQVAADHVLDTEPLGTLQARLQRGPVHPQTFGIYYDLVLALEDQALDQAKTLLTELGAVEHHEGLTIIDLQPALQSAAMNRMHRHLDTREEGRLRFAPPSEEQSRACRGRIQAALDRLETHVPALSEEIKALTNLVVLAVGDEDAGDRDFDGAASFTLWGSIFLNATSYPTVIQSIQALCHESAHNLLFGLSADGPLVLGDGDEALPSPLRTDPRPLDGVYHATFVSARMHYALATLEEVGGLLPDERDEVKLELAKSKKAFTQGISTVREGGRLSTMGEAVLDAAEAYMSSSL